MVPHVRTWLRYFKRKPRFLIEPFAGGGIISLTAAAENLVDQVIMVELDPEVASVWQAILKGDAFELIEKIITFPLTNEAVDEALASPDQSIEQKAFKTILRNRINHGGILAPGAGKIKNGEKGKGIFSRWYPNTLKQRILDIQKYREKILFIEGDGMSVIDQYQHEDRATFFIDPPYTAAGKKAGTRLYTFNELDHNALFRKAKSLRGEFLMTYDYSDGIIDLAQKFNLEFEKIAMQNTHLAKMNELIISKDLNWLFRTFSSTK